MTELNLKRPGNVLNYFVCLVPNPLSIHPTVEYPVLDTSTSGSTRRIRDPPSIGYFDTYLKYSMYSASAMVPWKLIEAFKVDLANLLARPLKFEF